MQEAVLITGSARSGTTIIGKLLHSLNNVEYAFEPPLLFAHIPLINYMQEDQWRLIYETYLFEDQHLDAVAGRRLNFNEHDDSNIYKAKDSSLVEHRLNLKATRNSTLPKALKHKIAYKLPDMLPYISTLHDYYPAMTIVIMFRKAQTVVSSLLMKRWFSDDSLENSPAIWPSKVPRKPYVPFWVPDKDIKLWSELNETDRCMYYYALMYKHVQQASNTLIVDYDHFLMNPKHIISEISQVLDCPLGYKSEGILNSIQDQESTQIVSEREFKSEFGLAAKAVEQRITSLITE